jgi:hypothetical protein
LEWHHRQHLPDTLGALHHPLDNRVDLDRKGLDRDEDVLPLDRKVIVDEILVIEIGENGAEAAAARRDKRRQEVDEDSELEACAQFLVDRGM